MAEKIKLTDRKLKALKPADEGVRYEVMDDQVSGFGVRVTDKGKSTFILLARYGGPKSNPTRRALGEYPTDSLSEAREKAREWRKWIEKGKDPKHEEGRLRRAELRNQQTTFASVAEDFLKLHVKNHRKAKDTEREIRKELIKPWGTRPITSITRQDVVALVDAITLRPAPYLAHIVLGHIRSLFNWAINRGTYGLESSPCDRLKPKSLIGKKSPRQRVLYDAELRALWAATERLSYPYGPVFRLLALTGCRKSEIGAARWGEIDEQNALLTVPPERFKSDATPTVPLSDDALAIISDLPRWKEGDFIFSTRGGRLPVGGWSKAKAKLDQLMAKELGGDLDPFVTHDIRRTVRTRLSSLVPSDVAELVIGHTLKGLHKVYDQHSYLDEKRHALELWAARLRSIVTPPPDNLVPLRKKQA